MTRAVILDVDTGLDDALALLLALRSPELEVVGVTCVAGNVTIDHVTRNTLATLDVLGADLPVAVGAYKPLVGRLHTSTFFHGRTGLGNIAASPSCRRPVDDDAAAFLARAVRARPGDITVIALGPLTNVALALLKDPAFADQVAELTVMGGAVGCPGNATSAAEANFRNDPEAAAAVTASGIPLTVVDLGVTNTAVLPRAHIDALPATLSSVGEFARALLRFYAAPERAMGFAGAVLHDPLAVALTIDPTLATMVPVHLAIETAGRYTRGASVGNFTGFERQLERMGDSVDLVTVTPISPNARVPRDLDVARFLELFTTRLQLDSGEG